MIYLYVLLAIAVTDQPAQQTIRYHATMQECIEHRNALEPKIDKSYVRLDCVPVKANIKKPEKVDRKAPKSMQKKAAEENAKK
jgi:hypothetical protein